MRTLYLITLVDYIFGHFLLDSSGAQVFLYFKVRNNDWKTNFM